VLLPVVVVILLLLLLPYSQNDVIFNKNPNLTTSYNGSLVKATGTYGVGSSARAIYLTHYLPYYLQLSDYNGIPVPLFLVPTGVGQTLGTTGVSATFTGANYNLGDVFKIASWFVETFFCYPGGTKNRLP